MKVEIDLTKSITKNAGEYYIKSKKAKAKILGAEKALAETKGRIEKLMEKKEKTKEAPEIVKKEKRRMMWYEKFRWFKSSDGLMVLGGRDATTNDILIKKHVEPNDLVFHADVHGAPFFVVKNSGGKPAPENTIREAAEAAASYSSAWKKGVGSCDVYYVKPEQVSKTAESGEYLPRGGFMVRGGKNWLRKTPLRIAVGFKLNDVVEVIGGPVDAVRKNAGYYVTLGVGDVKSKELAEKIRGAASSKSKKEDGEKIMKVRLDEIQKWIPGGRGRITRE